jgi:hypothetical protein
MKYWDRLFSFNYTKLKPKLINYFILLKTTKTSTNHSINSKTKLIVAASTSLISSFAYFYFSYLNSNESKSLALTRAANPYIDEYDEYENIIIRNYKRKKECNRLVKRYKVNFNFLVIK